MTRLERLARWVVRRRLLVLGTLCAITLGLGVAATRLHVEVDPDAQLPQGHPYVETLDRVHTLFGDKNLVVVGLFPHDGQVFTPAFLHKLARVTEKLRHVPGANPALIQSLAAPQVKAIGGNADGLVVEAVMPEPPTDAAGAAAVRARAFANDAWIGTLVAADGSAAAVQASFELTPATPGYRQLDAAVRAAIASEDDGTFTWRLSGPVAFLSQLSAYSSRMAYLFPLALLVIGLVHYEAFRTLQALVLPLATGLLSVLWALGLMGLAGVALDPFNTTTPVLILAVAAGHAVQVLKRFYEEYDRCGDVETAVVASLRTVGPVMLAAGAVAALSFASLVTFGTASIRTFGIFTAFGIVSALVIEATLIPAVRAMLPAPARREREREAAAHPILDRLLGGVAALATRRPWRVLGAAGLLVALCGLAASRLAVDMSVKRQFREGEAVRVDDAALNDAFAGTSTLILLLDGGRDGGLEEPGVLAGLWKLQGKLAAAPGVGKVTSYVDFVRRMHLALNADRADAGELPASRELVAQYLFLYGLSGGADDFDVILDPTHRWAKVRLLVRDDSTHAGEALIARAAALAATHLPPGVDVAFTGTIASIAASTEVMVHGKLRNILQIAAITVAVSALLLRSFLAGLLVVVPLALTVAVNFGVMGLLRVPLDGITATISAMAVGIGADYAMYLLFRVREERATSGDLATALRRALDTSGKAVCFVASAIAVGYATLCLSGFALHVELGALVALAMLVSAASALVVLPALLTVLRPAFVEAGAGARPVVAAPEAVAAHA
ncbi:MAG: MMPL family transporter [bacterium]|nr:MMPL family transporter [bacterium]